MKITEIIKDAFLFPSKNTGRFAIYLLLSVLMAGFILGGILTYGLGFLDGQNFLLGGIYLIIALLIGCILTGYHISIIKSGIERDDEVPVFKLFENFMTGFDNLVVAIFYFLIPTLIVLLIAMDTNLFTYVWSFIRELGVQLFNVYIMGSSPDLAVNALSPILSNFAGSLSVTITAALILYFIFYILLSLAEARLANTGSVREALNMYEVLKDIKRIGVGRLILCILLIFIIFALIESILVIVLGNYVFLLLVLVIIISPYLSLVARRAVGLIYSDIT